MAARAPESIVRPRDMSQDLFERLCTNYQLARNKYNQSVTRNARPETIAKNEKARDDEHAHVKALLDNWSSNHELRQLVIDGNKSSGEAVRLLTEASNMATTRHHELVGMLNGIQGALINRSSSSTDPLPVEVEEPVVVEVADTDECVLCMSDNPNGPALPCCWQGNHRACKECYMDLFKSNAGKHFKCPSCRTEFKDFGMLSQDLAQFDRFKAFILGLPLPKKLLEFLLAREAPPTRIVLLADLRTDIDDLDSEVGFGNYHEAVVMSKRSTFHPNYSPLWARIFQDGMSDEEVIEHKLDAISFEGDAIHQFVDRVCGGIWPPRGIHVELRCIGCIYPIHYKFERFVKDDVAGDVAHFQVMSCQPHFDDEYVDIPLSAIVGFKSREPCDIRATLGMGNAPWSPIDVVCELHEQGGMSSWHRLWIKSVNFVGVCPTLTLGHTHHAPFERVVTISKVRTIRLVIQPDQAVHVIGLPLVEQPKVFVGMVAMKWNSPANFRIRYDYKEFKILGYTQMGGSLPCLEAIGIIDNRKVEIPLEYVSSISYRRSC